MRLSHLIQDLAVIALLTMLVFIGPGIMALIVHHPWVPADERVYHPHLSAMKRSSVLVLPGFGVHGSGFVISQYEVGTAWHVVDRLDEGSIIMTEDGKRIGFTKVRRLGNQDAAIITLDTPLIGYAAPLQCEPPHIGQPVVGVAHPMTLRWVTTQYVVAALTVPWRAGVMIIQGEIMPGMSGGPVFNTQGKVVGITVAGVYSQDRTVSNFAVTEPAGLFCE